MGTALLLGLSLLALAPFALGAGLGVVLKHPYHGVVWDGTAPVVSPVSCPGTGNFVVNPATFDLKNGRGTADFESSAVPCTSWVSELAAVTGWFGMNTTSFTPAAGATNDHIKVKWSLDYDMYLNASYGGPNNTAYAYADVQLDASLLDVTTDIGTNAVTIFHNVSYIYDATGQIFFTVYPTTVVETIVANLVAGDTYQIHTVLTCQTGALVTGPVGSATTGVQTDEANAIISFPSNPAGAVLESISY